MKTFPSTRFDDLTLLASTPGSFWTEIFDGRELVVDYLRGAAVQERQLEQLGNELFDSMGRNTCPVYHTDIWLPVELSEADGASASKLRYGDDVVYGPQPSTSIVYLYGAAKDASWQFPTEAELKAGYLLTDGLVNPSVCMAGGVEFYISAERQQLVFAEDPFKDPRFTPFTDTDGVRKLRLYLFMASLDWDYVPKLYGSVLSLNGQSSEAYKDLVNAVLDGISQGTSTAHILRAVAAVTGVPVAEGDEVVEVVTQDATNKLIITDQNVYKFPLSAEAVVAVGDEVSLGDQLVDTVSVYEPNTGVVPSFLSQLAFSTGLLFPGLGELVFQNQEVPLTVTTGVSGKTKVTFPLGGFQTDIDAFFTELHTRGVAAGDTLANYLDLRPVSAQTTEPTALNLPATINPLELLFENLLRYCAYVVRLKLRDLPDDGAGLDKLSVLRKIAPPHAMILFVLELADMTDDVTMEDEGSSVSTGYSEDYSLFTV